MIDLRKKDRVTLTRIAQQYLVEGTELRVYGSRVKGRSVESSDLDLVMFTPKGKTNDLASFKEALQGSNIPIFVQIFDWNHFPSHFQEQFMQNNECLLVVC